MSKREYADSYDRLADKLYRFALCVSGDKYHANCVMANLFVEGFVSYEDDEFEAHMLKVLWRLLESCPPCTAEQYRSNICSPQSVHKGIMAADIMSGIEPEERAVLMLGVMFSKTEESICDILDISVDAARCMNGDVFRNINSLISERRIS